MINQRSEDSYIGLGDFFSRKSLIISGIIITGVHSYLKAFMNALR